MGWYFIRRGAWRRHMVCMIIAFLVCLFSLATSLIMLGLARSRGIHRLARGGLLSDSCLARSSGVCDLAIGHSYARSSFSSPMGPAHTNRALDNPYLAVRVGYRRSSLLNALQMGPSTGALEL